MNFFKKLSSVFIILLALTSILPNKAYALDGGGALMLATKEYGLDGLAWYAANRVIKKISSQTVNWINSGFKGKPAYLTDPGQFFQDTADDTVSEFLTVNLAKYNVCAPFNSQVRLALVKNYINDGVAHSCTLSVLKDNYDAFTDDFTQGGWDGWFEMTQNPSNNPYGAYITYNGVLQQQIASNVTKYANQIIQGNGFLNFQRCKKGTENSFGDCFSYEKETVTPGSVIQEQLNESLGGGLKRLEAADEIDEIIGALLDQLINKALGSVGGLFGASKPDASGKTYTTDLMNDTSDAPKPRAETNCSTTPDTVDSDGNTVPGVSTCTVNPTPVDTSNVPGVTCTPDSNGVLRCIVDGSNAGSGSGTNGGSKCAIGKGNDAGAPTTINESQIVWDDADIGGWAVTANLSVSTAPDTMNLNYDKASTWPNVFFPMFNGAPVVGNAWVVVWRNGAWHASTFEWLRPGQTAKDFGNLAGADGTLASPLGNFTPQVGETYGFVVSTPARGGNRGPVNERSNVATMVWTENSCPNGSTGTGTGGTGGTGGTSTPPPPSSGPQAPTITSVTPTDVVSGVTTITINGTNLQNSANAAVNVVFLFGGQRTTVSGRSGVNSSGTQTSVVVPDGITATSGYVLIDNGTGLVSNSIPITYQPNVVATVTSTDATVGYGSSVAYNPTNNTFLVTSAPTGWQGDNNIYGRIMSANGTAVSAPFLVNASTDDPLMNKRATFTAYSPNINKYLVLYITFPNGPAQIVGQFINPDGTRSGNSFVIFNDAGGFSFLNQNTTLQYDPVNKKFVFVWEYRTPAINSNLITINDNGTVGPVVPLTADVSADDGTPAVAVNTTTGKYCVVYSSIVGVGASGWIRTINMKTYDPVTGVLGTQTVVDTKNSPSINTWPTIVYNSVSNKYMVGWGTATVSQAKILNSCSGSSGGTAFTSNAFGAQTIAYNSASNTYASIAQGPGFGNGYVVYNSSGIKIREGIAFSGGRTGNYNPILVPNTTTGTFSAITSTSFEITRFAVGL